MKDQLLIYSTLTRKKEIFQPINFPYVGMYVCGPTVYSDVHLGNCRTFISFDLIYRYLTHLGYKVRYVRNITDAGHLESDADEGEDKISKRAKLEQLEPMEIVQRYTYSFHKIMKQFNVLSPSIEPTATGHICEQIEMAQKIIDNGYAYIVDGSVYFNVDKYNKNHNYGKLSGRLVEELITNTRALSGQDEKKGKLDFALWIKAKTEHIMKWPSPWGWGFPGWHLECSAMSAKYLGESFDIHGGGMDLIATHHTNEIAQSQACCDKDPVKYWIHTNMLTVKGQRMGKSLGNAFLPQELFTGNHPLLDKGYPPMAVRFFMLQTHYSSTLDFSNEALQASEKAYKKIINGLRIIKNLSYKENKDDFNEQLNKDILKACDACKEGMNDDFNSAITIANLFNLLKYINSFNTGALNSSALMPQIFEKVKSTFTTYVEDILGLAEDNSANPKFPHELINIILKSYGKAKQNKDYKAVDEIRTDLKKLGIIVKDQKMGFDWAYEE